MPTDHRSIAVIIVNYRTAELVISHLDQLVDALSEFRSGRIFIVDNASPGGDLQKLEHYVADKYLGDCVTVIDAGANLGFAGGNNAAFGAVKNFGADYIFFLNPDASPVHGAIKALALFLDEHEEAAIAGPQLLDERGEKSASEFAFPTAVREFAGESGIRPLQRMTGQFRNHKQGHDLPVETDWVSGAAFMARTAAFTDQLMDDDYFLYYEETDMMRRLRKNGWQIWHVPHARVVHIGGASTEITKDTRLSPYWYSSWRRYYRKNYGLLYPLYAGLMKTLGLCVYHLRRVFTGRKNYRPPHYLADVSRECFWRAFTKE